MKDYSLIDSRIESVLIKNDELVNSKQIRNFDHPSFLINTWIECERVLLVIYKENEVKTHYYNNLYLVVLALTELANSKIINAFVAGMEHTLLMKIPGAKFGSNILEEYNYFYRKLNEIKKDIDTEEMFLEKQIEFNGLLNKLKNRNSGCYIATMAYGDYEHPQVMELRKFRDDYLSKTILGRSFIKLYYKYSPSLVEKLKNKQSINLIIRKGLDQFIKTIRK
ncbi:MAG: CFI-box-CTERM domain-containing protein [Lutibacter sp.]